MKKAENHEHCWHAHRGPIWMVIPNGHIAQQCCECQAIRTVHVDHAHDRRLPDLDMWPNRDTERGTWSTGPKGNGR